ncbi:GD19819 [Drosophila simulans]|uniref:GD19819 n=1 Tax=Drosophila simulans TaxID=7240 RepID=B4QXJ9_DROSI|nr:GD19819 [Drosophila simulans]
MQGEEATYGAPRARKLCCEGNTTIRTVDSTSTYLPVMSPAGLLGNHCRLSKYSGIREWNALLSPEIDGILSQKLACIDHSPARWVTQGVESAVV